MSFRLSVRCGEIENEEGAGLAGLEIAVLLAPATQTSLCLVLLVRSWFVEFRGHPKHSQVTDWGTRSYLLTQTDRRAPLSSKKAMI
jgi:hypothetical protein